MPNLLPETKARAKVADASAVGFFELRKRDPDFPPPVKIGAKNAYVEEELDDYIRLLMSRRNSKAGD